MVSAQSRNTPSEEARPGTLISPFLGRVVRTIVAHKRWFLLSVMVCMVAAFIYQARLPRLYRRTSIVSIRNNEGDDSRRSRTTAQLSLSGIDVNGEVEDEAFVLKSHKLMRKVVEKLGLNTDYTIKHGLRRQTLYKDSPVRVAFLSSKPVAAGFDISAIGSADSCHISNFTINGSTSAFSKTIAYGKATATPAGTIVVEKTAGTTARLGQKPVHVSHTGMEQAATRFTGCISTAVNNKQSQLIFVACQDANARRADDILACLMEEYKNDIIETKNRRSINADRFLTRRIAIIGNELGDAESRMASFKQSNDVVDFEKNTALFLDQSSTAEQTVLQLENERNVGLFLRDYLAHQGEDGRYEVVPTMGEIANTSLQNSIMRYNELVMEYNRLSANAGMASPVVRNSMAQLKAMHSVIAKSVENYISTVDVELRQAYNVKKNINSAIAVVPQKEKSASDIERQRKIKEELYIYLLNKREEVALNLAVTEANVNIVEPPYGNASPVYPHTARIMVAAFGIGIAIPTMVFWLITFLDTKVRNRKEIEEEVSAPILGEIPLWRNDGGVNKLVAPFRSGANYNALNEAFRVVRYNLNFIGKDAKVIMLTSSVAGSGKSFVSRHLAMILGTTGKRVILVDADIRKRTQSKHISSGDGLTSYLSDINHNLDELIVADSVGKNVDFLPAGITPPNPSELLMSPRLDKLTEELRSRYDYVIFDTTPAIAVADAGIVNRVADLTIYIIRIGEEDKRFLPEIEKMYREQKFKHMAVVVNGSTKSSYNYGYGYGYDDGRKHRKSNRKKHFNSV